MIVNENSDKVTISIVHPHDPSPSDICILNSQTYWAFICQKF